ncbi:MAG: hypothetical protein GX940_01990 [Clostridiaceae bacterium]|jgi:hypothetical protein|nr:hypothetical protein [Clostridiaceae bacterium]
MATHENHCNKGYGDIHGFQIVFIQRIPDNNQAEGLQQELIAKMIKAYQEDDDQD